jgi:hypothetical protein
MIGVVYRLYNDNGSYYGSSCNINKRIIAHRYPNIKCSSYRITKDPFQYEILENLNIESKIELYKRERWYIENNECVNKNKPCPTLSETKHRIKIHHQIHEQSLKKYIKEYNLKNKERLDIMRNEKFNCICGGRYTYQQKQTHLKTKKHQKSFN